MEQCQLKTKLKCLGARTYQNSYKDFISKEANNEGSSFLNYIDFYKDCKSMTILSLPNLISALSHSPKPNSTVSFCRVLVAGRNVILHFWLAWLTLSFFSFNICPSSSYLIRSKWNHRLFVLKVSYIHVYYLTTVYVIGSQCLPSVTVFRLGFP